MTEIILTSSALILFLAALRRLLRGRIHPTVQYALWLLVAARLLIPGALFPAPVSLMGAARELQALTQAQQLSADIPRPLFAPSAAGEATPASLPARDSGAASPSAPALPLTPSPRPPRPILLIWAGGCLLTGSALAVSNLLYWRGLRRRRRSLSPHLLPQAVPARVYTVTGAVTPCLFGLLRPAIYINEEALAPERLPHILTHEAVHLRHRDHLWALLRCLCLTLHWYNPLVWWAAALSRRDCELSCDAETIRQLGEAQRIGYGKTLLAMARPRTASLLHTATAITTGKRAMTERITLIASRPRTLKLTLAAVVLLMCGASVFFFGGAAPQAPSAPPSPLSEENPDGAGNDLLTAAADPIPAQVSASEAQPPASGTFPHTPQPQDTPAGTLYTHSSRFFSLRLPDSSYRVSETATGVTITRPGEARPLQLLTQPSQWLAQQPSLSWALGSFDTNGTAQTYLLESDTPEDPLVSRIADSFQLHVTADTVSHLVRDGLADDTDRAIAYLPYLSWLNYREQYGEDGLRELLTALRRAAEEGLTWDRCHDLLSALPDAAIDDAFAPLYRDTLRALRDSHPQRFASVLLSQYIAPQERESALHWLGLDADDLAAYSAA